MLRPSGLRSSQRDLTAAQKSAEGIVSGTSFAEGLNAFRATEKSEARTATPEGTEADPMGSII